MWQTLNVRSLGIVGTRFWRAPVLLQQNGHLNFGIIFTSEMVVYSYGFPCYELVITVRCKPFEDCQLSGRDHVRSESRPDLPADLDLCFEEIRRSRWHSDPKQRPNYFQDIIEKLAVRSCSMSRYLLLLSVTS